MRKRERLLNLLCLLWSSKRRFTRQEIFRRMAPYRNYANPETARRTFERDKKALRQVGFDIQTSPPEEGPATYVLAQPTDALEQLELTESERIALAMAVGMVDLGDALAVGRTLVKLGAGPSGEMGSTSLDVGGFETDKAYRLLGAVQSRSQVFFDYKGTRRRGVEPLQIVNRRGHWYLQAREDGMDKVFRIDRLSDLYVSDRKNMYDWEPSPEGPNFLTSEPWEYGGDETVETVVRFDAGAAWYIRPRIPASARITEENDGDLTVATLVTDRAAFFAWMLEFASDGEIISPRSVRREMVEWVRQSMEEARS